MAALLGVRLDAEGLDAVMDQVGRTARGEGAPFQIITVNLNTLTLARKNLAFRDVINRARLSLVDGRILLWALRGTGEKAFTQVTGHDLMRESIAMAARDGLRLFLLGGGPGVAATLAEKLRREHPGLAVDHAEGGRFSPTGESAEDAALLRQMSAFQPHLLFVALGAPKQFFWIERHLAASGARVAMGIGGVFDTLVGSLPRAPRWMQVAGLESLFQLIIEPRRYWRRYLLDDPPTLWRLVRDCAAKRA